MTAPVASFANLLKSAVETPGVISKAYSAFHNFSVGNQLLAWAQRMQRGIAPGPLATFPKWKELGRYVKKGEKAITLCQPVTIKRKAEHVEGERFDDVCFTRFIYKPHWFVLAQTEGAAMPEQALPTWDRTQALASLDIAQEALTHMDGNCQGYARGRTIAVSPVAALPFKTTVHELAHVCLGHTTEHGLADGELTPRSLREAEAECVAMLCCAALELPGIEECRGYVQGWWGAGNPIPERSAQRILKAADMILKAGAHQAEERLAA
jgi:antirestriction protein ArdC